MAETLKDIFVHHLHYWALGFMAVVYIVKIRWILKFNAVSERTPARGDHAAGVRFSFQQTLDPRAMESNRMHPMHWVEFVILHLGVSVGITATILMPHLTGFFWNPAIAWTLRVIIGLSFLVATVRLWRRVTDKNLKLITHPDDLFAIFVMWVWFAIAFFGIAPLFGTASSVDAYSSRADLWMVGILFAWTTFLLVYVPFSKISHYIFWPFQRYYIGKHLGHRGVFPKVKPAGQA